MAGDHYPLAGQCTLGEDWPCVLVNLTAGELDLLANEVLHFGRNA